MISDKGYVTMSANMFLITVKEITFSQTLSSLKAFQSDTNECRVIVMQDLFSLMFS